MSVNRRVVKHCRQSVQNLAGGNCSLLGLLLSIPGLLRGCLRFSLSSAGVIKFALCNYARHLLLEGRMKVWTVTPLGTVTGSMELARRSLREPLARSSFIALSFSFSFAFAFALSFAFGFSFPFVKARAVASVGSS